MAHPLGNSSRPSALSIRVPKEARRAIEQIAAAEARTLSQVAAMLVMEALAARASKAKRG